MNLSDRRYVGIIGLVLAAFLIVLLPLTATTSVSVPVAQPAPPDFGFPPSDLPPSCLSELPVHYYTQDPDKVSPNAFGPSAVTDNPIDAFAELRFRLCGDDQLGVGGDQALFTAIMSAVDGSDPNSELSRDEWES